MAENDIRTLAGLLDEMSTAGGEEDVSVEALLEVTGERSFGALLLMPGLIALSPLSGIPGTPTFVGLMTLLITSQLLIGRSRLWLPQFMLQRKISRRRFDKLIQGLHKFVRPVDRLIKPRLTLFASGPGRYVIIIFCLLLSLITPLLELLPFVITAVGAAISAFGAALLARDGLLTLLAFGFCSGVALVTLASTGS